MRRDVPGVLTRSLPALLALTALWASSAAAWQVAPPGEAPAAGEVNPADQAPAEVRQGIERTLRDMERAVLAADQPAYLALVDLSEPVFAQETRMWAAELARNRPLEFELSLKEGTLRGTEDTAEAELVMRWTMSAFKNEAHVTRTPEQAATPGKPRTLSVNSRFIRRGETWVYAGEVWNVVEAPGVRVFYEDGLEKTARGVAEVLPEVRAHVEEGFGLAGSALPAQVQHVKLYRTMLHLQASIYLSYDDGIGGWNEPGESIKILVSRGDRDPRSLKPVLAHEFGHVATFFMGDKATDMPWWALEGVAELAAESYGKSRAAVDRQVRSWAKSGDLKRWEQLADFRGEAQEHQGQVYAQGHHMLGYLSERFGREARNAWLTAMARGASLQDASVAAFGSPWELIDEQWRAAVEIGPPSARLSDTQPGETDPAKSQPSEPIGPR